MSIQTKLERLGFSANEAIVYLFLAKNGAVQAGPIVRETKLHRALVYTALDRLGDAGLVTVTRKKNIQIFQPNSPESIFRRVESTQQIANEVVPELKKLLNQHQHGVEVRTLVGREGFVTNLYDVLISAEQSAGKELCIMGGAGSSESNPFEVTGDAYPAYLNASKEKKVKKRLIISPRYEALYRREYGIHGDNQLRVLENGLSSPSLTRITSNMVTIEMYQPQIVILQIRHAQIAQSYLEVFNALWEKARK